MLCRVRQPVHVWTAPRARRFRTCRCRYGSRRALDRRRLSGDSHRPAGGTSSVEHAGLTCPAIAAPAPRVGVSTIAALAAKGIILSGPGAVGLSVEVHHEYADQAAAYALGALTPAERADFEAHLANCALCA